MVTVTPQFIRLLTRKVPINDRGLGWAVGLTKERNTNHGTRKPCMDLYARNLRFFLAVLNPGCSDYTGCLECT